jgi:hypothetical protein
MWYKFIYLCFIGLAIGDRVSMNSKNFSLNSPQKLSNCKAKLDDGSIVDLTSQDKPNSPRL